MQKNLPNLVAIVGFLWSCFYTLIKLAFFALDSLGLVEFTSKHKDFLNMAFVSVINWTAIYIMLGLFSATYLVLYNYEFWRGFYRKYKRNKEINWDMSFKDAMNYLIHTSYMGRAWPKSKSQYYAAEALREAAVKFQMPIGATLNNTYSTQSVNMKGKDIKLVYKDEYGDIKLLRADLYEDKDALGGFLFFDEKHIRKKWRS